MSADEQIGTSTLFTGCKRLAAQFAMEVTGATVHVASTAHNDCEGILANAEIIARVH